MCLNVVSQRTMWYEMPLFIRCRKKRVAHCIFNCRARALARGPGAVQHENKHGALHVGGGNHQGCVHLVAMFATAEFSVFQRRRNTQAQSRLRAYAQAHQHHRQPAAYLLCFQRLLSRAPSFWRDSRAVWSASAHPSPFWFQSLVDTADQNWCHVVAHSV